VVNFLEGASGSTHNIRGRPELPSRIERLKARGSWTARSEAQARACRQFSFVSIKRPFTFPVRSV
jgi:hypothetical protein